MSRINLQLYQPRTKLEQFEDIIMESKLLNGFNSSAAAAAAVGGKLRDCRGCVYWSMYASCSF